jgi:hypothetical protein
MNLITALEIYSNPFDLAFSILGISSQKQCFPFIWRGPGGNYEHLFIGPAIGTKEEVITYIRNLLKVVVTKGEELLLQRPDNQGDLLIPKKHGFVEGYDEPRFLTESIANRILLQLEEDWVVYTFQANLVKKVA